MINDAQKLAEKIVSHIHNEMGCSIISDHVEYLPDVNKIAAIIEGHDDFAQKELGDAKETREIVEQLRAQLIKDGILSADESSPFTALQDENARLRKAIEEALSLYPHIHDFIVSTKIHLRAALSDEGGGKR